MHVGLRTYCGLNVQAGPYYCVGEVWTLCLAKALYGIETADERSGSSTCLGWNVDTSKLLLLWAS